MCVWRVGSGRAGGGVSPGIGAEYKGCRQITPAVLSGGGKKI